MMTPGSLMAGSKGAAVGRKRTPLRGRGKTPREIFARRLNQLWGQRSARELAEKCGVTPEAAAKWLQGVNVPDLDMWPAVARALGVSSSELVSFD